MLYEELLQVFISVVDTKLLETVVGEIFKAEDIEYTNRRTLSFFRLIDGTVDLLDYKNEETTVYSFDESVSNVYTLVSGKSGYNCFSVSEEGSLSQGINEWLRRNFKEVGNPVHVCGVWDFSGVQVVDYCRSIFYVAYVEY